MGRERCFPGSVLRAPGAADGSLCIANIRSELNLVSNNQDHYGSALEEMEADTTVSSSLGAAGLKVVTRHRLQLKAKKLLDGSSGSTHRTCSVNDY